MQAIRTVYYGPGNVRGSCIIARAAAGRLSVPYNHALGIVENHRTAAIALVRRFGWDEHADYDGVIGGQLADGSYAWVLDERLADRGAGRLNGG